MGCWRPEEEPAPCDIDNWARGKVPSKLTDSERTFTPSGMDPSTPLGHEDIAIDKSGEMLYLQRCFVLLSWGVVVFRLAFQDGRRFSCALFLERQLVELRCDFSVDTRLDEGGTLFITIAVGETQQELVRLQYVLDARPAGDGVQIEANCCVPGLTPLTFSFARVPCLLVVIGPVEVKRTEHDTHPDSDAAAAATAVPANCGAEYGNSRAWFSGDNFTGAGLATLPVTTTKGAQRGEVVGGTDDGAARRRAREERIFLEVMLTILDAAIACCKRDSTCSKGTVDRNLNDAYGWKGQE